MKAWVFPCLVSSAAGHGAMNVPLPRNTGPASVHPSPGNDRSCLGDACYWYSVGCFIGCEECSMEGKSLYPEPSCASPLEPTNNAPGTRSWDPLGQSSHGDFTKYNPWRAPGRAPLWDPCGGASGFKDAPPTAEVPAGYRSGDKGTEVLPAGQPTYWKAGGTAEVGWAIAAQHGGGYSYRLCPKDQQPTESCFQAGHLSFTDKNTTIRYHDGSRPDFPIPYANFVTPEGKPWRRNPIPGCACDLGLGCGTKGQLGAGMMSMAGGDIDPTPYAKHGSHTSDCPLGTMFEPGWADGSNSGFLVGFPHEWSIIDEVKVPDVTGDYILSWRWDCEETPQVWNSCADISVVKFLPPTPPPTPSPAPVPTPPAPKKCLGYNPTCKGAPFAQRKKCWFGGCKECDEATKVCRTCCEGCQLIVDGKVYCDSEQVVV